MWQTKANKVIRLAQQNMQWERRAYKIYEGYRRGASQRLRQYLAFEWGDHVRADRVNLISGVTYHDKVWTIRNHASEYDIWVVNTAGNMVVQGVTIVW